jgi:hypothetical protein
MDQAIIYNKPSTCLYGRRSNEAVSCVDYEDPGDFNEIINDPGVKWAKLIDMETGKIFKSYRKKD